MEDESSDWGNTEEGGEGSSLTLSTRLEISEHTGFWPLSEPAGFSLGTQLGLFNTHW